MSLPVRTAYHELGIWCGSDDCTRCNEPKRPVQTYIVRHDFSKSQPRWAGDYVHNFGPNNEGVPVAAESPQQARQLFAEVQRLNPFYLEAVPMEQ